MPAMKERGPAAHAGQHGFPCAVKDHAGSVSQVDGKLSLGGLSGTQGLSMRHGPAGRGRRDGTEGQAFTAVASQVELADRLPSMLLGP